MLFLLIPFFSLILLLSSCSGLEMGTQDSEVTNSQYEQIFNSKEIDELQRFIEEEYGDTSEIKDLLGDKITEMSPSHFAEFNRGAFDDIFEVIELMVTDFQQRKVAGEEPSIVEVFRTYYPKLKELHEETSESFSEKLKEFETELNRNEFWEDETVPENLKEKYVHELFQ